MNSDGTLNWEYDPQVTGTGESTPVIAENGTIYYAVKPGEKLVAVTAGGNFIWEYDLNTYYINTAAVASDGTIYVGGGGIFMQSTLMDHENGEKQGQVVHMMGLLHL